MHISDLVFEWILAQQYTEWWKCSRQTNGEQYHSELENQFITLSHLISSYTQRNQTSTPHNWEDETLRCILISLAMVVRSNVLNEVKLNNNWSKLWLWVYTEQFKFSNSNWLLAVHVTRGQFDTSHVTGKSGASLRQDHHEGVNARTSTRHIN